MAKSEGPAPVRVLVVDECELVTRGLGDLLSGFRDRVELRFSAAGSREVTAGVDVVLHDAFAGGPLRFEDVGRLRALAPGAALAVYTWKSPPDLVRLAIDLAMRGCLSKRLSGDRLVQALEDLRAGHIVIKVDGPAPTQRPVFGAQQLTARESEIISLVTLGLSNQQICEHLMVSLNTVKSYIRSAYRKMQVTSRTHAVLWGLEHSYGYDRLPAIQQTPIRQRLLEPVR